MGYRILSITTPPDNLRGLGASVVELARSYPAALALLKDGEAELASAEIEIDQQKQAEQAFRAAQSQERAARRARKSALQDVFDVYTPLRRQMRLLAQYESETYGLTLDDLSSFPAEALPEEMATHLEELVRLTPIVAVPLAKADYDAAELARIALLADKLLAAQARFAADAGRRKSAHRLRQETRGALLRRIQKLDAFLDERLPPEGLDKLATIRQTWLKRVRAAKAPAEPSGGGSQAA